MLKLFETSTTPSFIGQTFVHDALDIDALHAACLSDEEILAAITLIAHQNAISRMHHALAAQRK